MAAKLVFVVTGVPLVVETASRMGVQWVVEMAASLVD